MITFISCKWSSVMRVFVIFHFMHLFMENIRTNDTWNEWWAPQIWNEIHEREKHTLLHFKNNDRGVGLTTMCVSVCESVPPSQLAVKCVRLKSRRAHSDNACQQMDLRSRSQHSFSILDAFIYVSTSFRFFPHSLCKVRMFHASYTNKRVHLH